MKIEKNILIAFLLNISFSIFELIGGIFTNSIVIISDAIHDFADAISIGIAYFLEKKSKKKPDSNYTYGYARYSIIGAIITNSILIVGSFLVIYNAVKRIINPVTINYNGMILIAIFGIIVNFLAAYFTKEGDSLNQKAVNLHMLEDVLGWIVVLIGAIAIKFTKISIIDALMSILVAIFILMNAIKSYKRVIELFLEKTPNGINLEELKEHLINKKDIENVHHIHLWSIDGFNNYATMHVVTYIKNTKKLKEVIKSKLKEFGICHTTIEFESKDEHCEETECQVNVEVHQSHHYH